MDDSTRMIGQDGGGAPQRASELLPQVYEELRRLARQKMAAEKPGQTIQATALVHEAWMRLNGSSRDAWNSREHFFRTAAEAMRHILVDRARRRLAQKRGGGQASIDVDDVEIPIPLPDEQVIALHEALEKFCAVSPAKAELIQLRYFVGLSFDEAAAVLGIAVPTAKQWWAYARAWLRVEIRGNPDGTVAGQPPETPAPSPPAATIENQDILFPRRLRLIR